MPAPAATPRPPRVSMSVLLLRAVKLEEMVARNTLDLE
jgi:hypothetical protein